MHRAVIRRDGTLHLGDLALRQYPPGTTVEVIVTCTGTLMVCVDQSPPPIDVTFKPLTGGRAAMALRAERKRRRAG